jgi:hypothetical protein
MTNQYTTRPSRGYYRTDGSTISRMYPGQRFPRIVGTYDEKTVDVVATMCAMIEAEAAGRHHFEVVPVNRKVQS